jgi:hypothetical protein
MSDVSEPLASRKKAATLRSLPANKGDPTEADVAQANVWRLLAVARAE